MSALTILFKPITAVAAQLDLAFFALLVGLRASSHDSVAL